MRFLLLAIFFVSLALPQSGPSGKKTVAAKGKSAKTVRKSAPPRPMTPTPERYKEIQKSLADKGYLKSQPNGIWDDQSSEALRQFQTDQNLSPTGKISAATLIALGLGPSTAPVPPAPIAAPAQSPAPPPQ